LKSIPKINQHKSLLYSLIFSLVHFK